MKRQMDEMANELKTLRTKVMQTEVISSLESQREASHHPLTLVEKKALVKDVQKLISVPEHLNEVPSPLLLLLLLLPPRSHVTIYTLSPNPNSPLYFLIPPYSNILPNTTIFKRPS